LQQLTRTEEKRDDSRLIIEKHDHRLIKERGLHIERGEGGLGMERIKWRGLGSKDQDLRKNQT
jgi:hypothetical protein